MLNKTTKKFILAVIFLLPLNAIAEDQAKILFEQLKSMIFQIKVIDIGSGNKSTIGSGFLIDNKGSVATNYHVVSDFILEPEKYRIELLDHLDNTYPLSIINFDIIHDLALVKVAMPNSDSFLNISNKVLAKGNRIYSLGNPHDLGMAIIEGTYNGLVEGSRYKKYLFSGSLNGGMSGGPAIDSKGNIIGVNVSKGGEQLSFLVPVKHLKKLILSSTQALSKNQYNIHSSKALQQDQDQYYSNLIEKDWSKKDFMTYTLPDKIDKSLKCWGHTLDKEKNKYDTTHRHCRTEDRIYLGGDIYTGGFSYNYSFIKSDGLNLFQFYNKLEKTYTLKNFYNGDEEKTSNFKCDSNFIKVKNTKWKITTCIREYFDYRGLYDAGLLAMRIDQENEALSMSIKTTGISQKHIEDLHKKFLDSISWKE